MKSGTGRQTGPQSRGERVYCLERNENTLFPGQLQSNYKLIAFNDRKAVMTVSADNIQDPNQAHLAKVKKYSAVEEISQFVEVSSSFRLSYSAFAVNWRGVIAPQRALDMKSLRLTNHKLKLLSMISVEQTTIIHQHFHQSTFWVKLNCR